MKLLLSSLKKIETISDRYKSLRLMLFTDCRAYYSQDLFVYLYILATITPHLDVEKTISCEEVIQIREICEKYLTKEKSIYEQFDAMTKQQFGFNKTHSQLGGLKLAPLIRSILTNYRMMKINRIQEVGFVFLMLKKENYVEYQKFSYFISSLKLQTELKVKIVKLFLANCDLKTKNKKIAISESGFSRFLIQCPQFTFDLLSNIIEDQNISLKDLQHNSIQNDSPLASKRMSLQPSIQHLKSIHDIKSRISLNVDSAAFQNVVTASHNRLSTQKSILQTYQKESTKINDQKQKKAEKTSQLQSLSNLQNPSVLPKKIREYSYFTYQIAKFLQNEDETKYMTNKQKQFIQKYLIGHVMHCEIDQIVGIIDYFSNDMLEIICCEQKYLSIKEKTNDALNHARNSMFE